ncbi:ATP-dependent DNA ligase [Prauserella marina]|uniref:DNA ligase (ATP) n=1 Tax=Prauserella marina TaxID=530584 RepID=A0A222VY70_9PSEU|nr:non-homologous end-joining DNA ligase [Prauserella marina]ASR38854.1 ATP-dependent DNA ligase [Prauserella marina]PWV82422.1 DNA ligase D [Prauserella marina]SDC68758.1 DNA ligase D [Prauserella marina]
MLATLTDQYFSDPDWIFERKLDGVRALCVREAGEEPHLWSRNHRSADASYPELVTALAEQGGESFVADGEIVAFDGDQTSFAKLQPRIHVNDPAKAKATGIPVVYYLFDLLEYDGQDATRLPLRRRKELLRQAFDFHDPLRLSMHRVGAGERFLQQACERGWEGLIAKRADARYTSGRSRDWLKFKCVSDQEFVVGGFTDPSGARAGFGALLIGYYSGSDLRYAGKVGTGYGDATLRDLRGRLDDLAVEESPFVDQVREPRAHWVRPEMVVQVRFSEWTGDGRLRHPRFTGLRNDKAAHEVVREVP